MRTTMMKIARELDPRDTNLFLTQPESQIVYDVLDYPVDDELDSNVLYCTGYEHLQKLLHEQRTLNVLCCDAPSLQKPLALPVHINLIITGNTLSATAVKQLCNHRDRQDSFSQQLLSVLPNGDLDDLCQIAGSHFLNPVIICNPLFEISAFSSYFQACSLLPQYADDNLLNSAFREAMKSQDAEEPLICETGDHVRFAVSTITQSGSPVYHILMVEENVALTASDLTDLQYLNNALSIYHQLKPETDIEYRFIHEYFLIKLVEGNLSRHSVHHRISLLNIPFKKYFFMIAVSPRQDNGVSRIRLHQYKQELQQLFPGLSAVYKDLILILHTSDNAALSEYKLEALAKQLTHDNLYAGISNCFEDPAETKRYFRQAMDAIARGEAAYPEQNVYHFNRLLPYRLLSFLPSFTSLEDCIAPCVRRVMEYDKANNTDFMHTLRAYVNNVCHLTNTARELNMHRNSLVYRINRMVEIAGIQFDCGDAILHILLSLKALDMLESSEKNLPPPPTTPA